MSIKDISSRVFELLLENPGLVFKPGDSTLLVDSDNITARPYCIASHPCEPVLRFLLRRIEGGVLTTGLRGLQPGAELVVGPCFGNFHPQTGQKQVFIATGTGIAPFLAWLGDPAAPPPLALYYGVRYLEDAVDWERLQTLCPVARLAVSGEKVPGTWHGRVSGLMDSLPMEPGIHYYLCGVASMIEEFKTGLGTRGVPAELIHTESFFPV